MWQGAVGVCYPNVPQPIWTYVAITRNEQWLSAAMPAGASRTVAFPTAGSLAGLVAPVTKERYDPQHDPSFHQTTFLYSVATPSR